MNDIFSRINFDLPRTVENETKRRYDSLVHYSCRHRAVFSAGTRVLVSYVTSATEADFVGCFQRLTFDGLLSSKDYKL